ncbi:nucleoside hydrolase [Marivibrio halodurans]|uniref:Nucleoside hydrolase n=1 Tax=Marivibrio halodurans TaxID=2039722 RepID=A0A8J7RZH2_9PROT|nr:nucleoside hydrolase [Marivibrio halodurans]MBP5857552.1 nucleoside hydrolase [Marivibrio halodurans]
MAAVRRILIDCDPGLDDAAAILMALGARAVLDLVALTTVAGNVGLAAVTRNASGLLALAGRTDVPLHAGCPRALVGGTLRAQHVHGEGGIGGVDLPVGVSARSEHAVDAIRRIARESGPKGLTLVPIGPLTNIACALVMAPDIADCLSEIVVMGGAARVGGNVTPVAEFNFAADPHAARIVLESGVPVVVMPLDVTRQAVVTEARIDALRTLATPVGETLAAMLAAYRGRTGRAVLHDPCTIAYLLAPDLFRGEGVAATVDTASDVSMGRLVADWNGQTGRDPTVTIMSDLDADGFYDLLVAQIRALS